METGQSSRLLARFVKEIKFHNRNPNPKDLKALKLLEDKDTNPVLLLGPEDHLYRCRIIHSGNESKVGNHAEEGFFGFYKDECLAPKPHQTRDMRANYRYIPYLYCSRSPYTALCEVRPRFRSRVSVATIGVFGSLRLLDFTNSHNQPNMTTAKVNLFAELSHLFSLPVTEDDDTLDYVPTQFIAEYAKKLNYDGIAYKSSIISDDINKDPDYHNVVIFDKEKYYAMRSNIILVNGIDMDFKQIDADNTKLNLVSPVVKGLQVI